MGEWRSEKLLDSTSSLLEAYNDERWFLERPQNPRQGILRKTLVRICSRLPTLFMDMRRESETSRNKILTMQISMAHNFR